MAVRKIETELTLGGEKEFNDAMRACNSNLKTLRSDMALVSSEFRKNETSVEALTAKQKVLTAQYKQQQEVVEALRRRLEKMTETYGEDSAEADKYRQKLNAATVQLHKTEDALNETDAALKAQSSRFGQLGRAAEAAGKTVANVADGAVASFGNIAKGAAALSGVGLAAATALTTIGSAALDTLTGFAVDAAERSKNAYDQANELAEKAREAALQGNEDAAMEYLRQANALIDSIDADYLRFGETLETLKASSTAAKDALGKILLPALQDLSGEGAELLQRFSADMEAAAGDTEAMGRIMADYLREAVRLIREQLPAFGEIAVELLSGFGEGLDPELILDDILGIVDYILTTIEDHADELGAAAGELVGKLGSFLVEHGPDLIVSGAELIANIVAGFVTHIPDLLTQILSLPRKIVEAFKTADVDWRGLGASIVDGIGEGLLAAWEDLKSTVSGLWDKLWRQSREDNEIHSPSQKWARGLGKPMAEGVGVGFEDEMRAVSRDMQASVRAAMPGADALSFNASLAASGAGADGGGVTNLGGVSVVINGYNVRSDEELVQLIAYRLQDLLSYRRD